MKLIIQEVPSRHEPLSRKSTIFPTKPQGYDSKLNNAEQNQNGQGSPWPADALRALSEMATPPANGRNVPQTTE
jgi:hypothetical protein